jgi:hypothetical protein
MADSVVLRWQGHEHEHKPKGADWYWALGIVAAASTIASLLFQNYLLALLIIIASATLALSVAKHPPLHVFELSERGLTIGIDVYPFSNMHSFSVLEDIEGRLPPLLSIKNDSWISPHLLVPLEGVDVDFVYLYFLERVHETEHRHSLPHIVGSLLGF